MQRSSFHSPDVNTTLDYSTDTAYSSAYYTMYQKPGPDGPYKADPYKAKPPAVLLSQYYTQPQDTYDMLHHHQPVNVQPYMPQQQWMSPQAVQQQPPQSLAMPAPPQPVPASLNQGPTSPAPGNIPNAPVQNLQSSNMGGGQNFSNYVPTGSRGSVQGMVPAQRLSYALLSSSGPPPGVLGLNNNSHGGQGSHGLGITVVSGGPGGPNGPGGPGIVNHSDGHLRLQLLDDYGSKFTDQDVDLLRQLLVAGERHKWKQITKQINRRSAMRRGDDMTAHDEDSSVLLPKNVLPTYVIKQYQNLLGVPKNLVYFGVLGLLLPYVVAEKGWDDLDTSETFGTLERVD